MTDLEDQEEGREKFDDKVLSDETTSKSLNVEGGERPVPGKVIKRFREGVAKNSTAKVLGTLETGYRWEALSSNLWVCIGIEKLRC